MDVFSAVFVDLQNMKRNFHPESMESVRWNVGTQISSFQPRYIMKRGRGRFMTPEKFEPNVKVIVIQGSGYNCVASMDSVTLVTSKK